MSDMVEDLWPDILKRLTVRKLFEVRRVCKSWRSLIMSSTFVRRHNRHHVATISSSSSSRLLASVESNHSTCSLHHPDTNTVTPLDFPQPPSCIMFSYFYGGFVHGVALLIFFQLQLIPNNDDDDHKHKRTIKLKALLWNPSINKRVFLPWTRSTLDCGSYRLQGFGFDATNNDFKVVRSLMEGSYDVLSVREGVWRTDLPLPSYLIRTPPLECRGTKSRFLNGNIHWLIGHKPPFSELLLFDCEREEFNTTVLPPPCRRCHDQIHFLVLDLGTGSMLSLAIPISCASSICEVWVMDKYEDKAWTQLDRNNPTLGAAVASRDFIEATDGARLTHVGHSDLFRYRPTYSNNFNFHINETMMLMDIPEREIQSS